MKSASGLITDHKVKFVMGILTFLGIILVPSSAMGQAEENKSELSVVVAPVKMNVLYLGVENPLEVSAIGLKSSDLEVSTDNGKITGAGGRYIMNPQKQGNATIIISMKGQTIGKKTFRVKMIPTPVAKIAGMRGGSISKANLLKQEKVTVEVENFDFDIDTKAVGFKLYVPIQTTTGANNVDNSEPEQGLVSNSENITAEQKVLLSKVKSGDKILFDDIKASCPDGTIRNLGSLILTIQ